MDNRQYVCPKCGCRRYETDSFAASGTSFAKYFDVQNKKFLTVSCTDCGYTEIYREQTSTGENILDYLFGG